MPKNSWTRDQPEPEKPTKPLKAKKPRDARYRSWTFTHYDYLDDLPALHQGRHENISYIQWCHEICPSSKRPHLQGFVQFRIGQTLAQAQYCLGMPKTHVEPIRGSAESNYNYCSKDDTRDPKFPDVVRYGTFRKGQGERTDIRAVLDEIQAGASPSEIGSVHDTYIRYLGYFERFRVECMLPRHRDNPTTVTVIVGTTGTGKSRKLGEYADKHNAYYLHPPKHVNGSCWWNGYYGQKTVIIDEFEGWMIPYRYLLKILDCHPMKVETKGGMIELQANQFFMASNIHPSKWYPDEPDNSHLMRRITRIKIYKPEEVKIPDPPDFNKWLEYCGIRPPVISKLGDIIPDMRPYE